jgi:hypothetical protein
MPLGFGRSILTTSSSASPLAGANSISGYSSLAGAINRFGGGSLNPQDQNDYVEVDINPVSWSFSKDKEWTFEFWHYTGSSSGSINRTLVEFAAGSNQTPNDGVIIDTSDIIYFRAGGNIIASYGISLNTWYHLAMVCDGSGGGNNYKCYVGGDLKGTGNWTTTSGEIFRIGATYSSANGKNTYVDELRLSDNQRYTGNFTAPGEPFDPDLNTLLLMHFNFSPSALYDSTADL